MRVNAIFLSILYIVNSVLGFSIPIRTQNLVTRSVTEVIAETKNVFDYVSETVGDSLDTVTESVLNTLGLSQTKSDSFVNSPRAIDSYTSHGNVSMGNETYLIDYYATTNNNYNVTVPISYNETNNNYSIYSPTTNNYTTVNNNYYEENNYYSFDIDNNMYYSVTNNITNIIYTTYNTQTYDFDVYVCYFMTPNGQNSYNLTADDVSGVVWSYDVYNYGIAQDSNTVLALFPLDENFDNIIPNSNIRLNYEGSDFVEGKFEGALRTSSVCNNAMALVGFNCTSYTLEFDFFNAIPTNYDLCGPNGSWIHCVYYYYPNGTRRIFFDGKECLDNGYNRQYVSSSYTLPDYCPTIAYQTMSVLGNVYTNVEKNSANYFKFGITPRTSVSEYDFDLCTSLDIPFSQGSSETIHNDTYFLTYTPKDIGESANFFKTFYKNLNDPYYVKVRSGNAFNNRWDYYDEESYTLNYPTALSKYILYQSSNSDLNTDTNFHEYPYLDSVHVKFGHTNNKNNEWVNEYVFGFNNPITHLPYTDNPTQEMTSFQNFYSMGFNHYQKTDFLGSGMTQDYKTTRSLGGDLQVDMSNCLFDNMRMCSGHIYGEQFENYVKPTSPFSSGYIFTAPVAPSGTSFHLGDIGVQSLVPVNRLRVGGALFNFSRNGDVYININEDGKTYYAMQYFNGKWNEVDFGVWNGTEWQNGYDFNFYSLTFSTDDVVANGNNYYIFNNSYVDVSSNDFDVTINNNTYTITDSYNNIRSFVSTLLTWIVGCLGAISFLPVWFSAVIIALFGIGVCVSLFLLAKKILF